MKTDNINWEERRWMTASIILAGMSAHYSNACISSHNAEKSVLLADSLIRILADSTRPSLCDDLYKEKVSE